MCSAKTLAGAFCYDYPHTEYLRHNAESSVDCLIKPDSVAVSKHVKPDSNSSEGKNILQNWICTLKLIYLTIQLAIYLRCFQCYNQKFRIILEITHKLYNLKTNQSWFIRIIYLLI